MVVCHSLKSGGGGGSDEDGAEELQMVSCVVMVETTE